MFWAGIGHFPCGAGAEPGELDGFAVVTTASESGMVDIHDRTPVVLPPDVAREWLETGLPSERAEDLARHHAEQAKSFEWFQVGQEAGRVGNDGAGLIAPLNQLRIAGKSSIKRQTSFDLF